MTSRKAAGSARKASRTSKVKSAVGKVAAAARSTAKKVVARKKAGVKKITGSAPRPSGQSGHVLGIGAPKVRRPVAGRKPKGLSVSNARPRTSTLRPTRVKN